jgi:hypothetical protein
LYQLYVQSLAAPDVAYFQRSVISHIYDLPKTHSSPLLEMSDVINRRP